MKNFALFTFSFEGAPIAKKLKDEGVNVLVGVIENRNDILTKIEHPTEEKEEEKKRRLSSYDGILDKMPAQKLVDFLKLVPNKEDWFIFPDMNHCWKFVSQLKGRGFKGIFCTEEDRMMEVDRDEAKKFVEENYPHIDHQKVFEFNDIEEAKKFLDGSDEIYVLKGKDEDAPTRVPKSDEPELAKEELIAELDKYKEEYEKSGFILEVKIADAIEHTVQGVWNDGQLVYVMDDIEAKPKNAGDIGELTGCSADLVFCLEPSDYLVEVGLPEVVHEMAERHDGVFVWDAALYISRRTNKIYFGEFCANRVGYNCFYSELSNLSSVSSWFDSVSVGENPFEYRKAVFSGSVRIFNNEIEAVKGKDEPSHHSKKDIGIHYIGDENNFWPMDVKVENEKLVTAGYSEDMCVVTGQGDTITELAENMYDNLSQLDFEAKRWTYRFRGDYTSTDYHTSLINRFSYANHVFYEQPDFDEQEDKKEKIEEIEKKLKTKYDSHLAVAKKKHKKELQSLKDDVKKIINGG